MEANIITMSGGPMKFTIFIRPEDDDEVFYEGDVSVLREHVPELEPLFTQPYRVLKVTMEVEKNGEYGTITVLAEDDS